MFGPDEPFIVVMSDHLFDWRLIERMTHIQLSASTDAVVLIDDTPEMVEWACGAHCDEHCKQGHCQVLVKVQRAEKNQVANIGSRLPFFDALEAGMYVVNSRLFEVLHELLATSIYCKLCDAMQILAERGRIKYFSTAEVAGAEWYGELTICSLPEVAGLSSRAVKPEWRHGAAELLRTCPSLTAPPSTKDSVLYELGQCIGEGSFSVVITAEAQDCARGPQHGLGMRPGAPAAASTDGAVDVAASAERRQKPASSLAVKVVRKGQEAHDNMERQIIWEVHVLQKLYHEHIVRVMDVIDVVDATYIVMEQIEGPELSDFIRWQPLRRLPVDRACRFFCHLLAALNHAHARGIVHCDIKPENIRLDATCAHVVLTDWGLALSPGVKDEPVLRGTPAYSAPEQLTGYDADTICGKRCVSPAIDVWSLGVTLYEMLCGHLPFDCESDVVLLRSVLRLRYVFPEHLPAEPRAVIDSMLQVAPCERATIAELIASPWTLPSGYLPNDALLCLPCRPPPKARCFGLPMPSTISSYLVTAVYLSLCIFAIWTHAKAAGTAALENI